MNRVGYQGVIDKVSAFYMKNLAQPWQTMFKVFNHCLTTRTSGHDQTKINILQMFHAVINQTNVDYATHIPQRIEEDYHSIKDDIPLVKARSHKDNPEHADDDDDKDANKVDEEEGGEMGSLETRTEEIKYGHLLGVLRRMCRRLGYMIQNMERKCITTKWFWKTNKEVNQVLHHGVLQLAEKATEDLIKNNLKPCIATTIIEDRDAFHSELPDLVSQEFNTQAPLIIEDLFNNYLQSNETVIDEDEVILEDETHKLNIKLQDVDKHVLTIYDYARMKATMNDALSNQFKNAKEYAYHLEQTTNFMENQIVRKSRQEDIRRLVPRPLVFFGPQRNLNEPPRSRVIWERVYDFQLGIESYQIKVNLTAPTLTFLIIEVYELYSIVDKPNIGLIYLNSKYEKQVMCLVEIVRFCDATLENDLKEVKLKIFQLKPWRKPPLLGEWKTKSTDDEAFVIINP
nr:hypothetical protein [Tanacetum cinerariifolium]